MLPTAEMRPVLIKLLPVMLATLVMLPVTPKKPPVMILPATTLAVVITGPVRLTKLPVYVGKKAATLALL